MTPAQEKKYWRDWGRVVGVNCWRMVKGRLDDRAVGPERSQWHGAVWAAASALAEQLHRAITAEDLRHGCHVVAIGRDKGHRDLTIGGESSRVFVLLDLLSDPTDLDAVMRWNDPGVDERVAMTRLIRASAPDRYIREVARRIGGDHFTDPFWEDLPLPLLRGLAGAIREATGDWQHPF